MERIKSMVGQKIAIYNNEQKVLLLKRGPQSIVSGVWDLPGGGILLNETPLECLEREIMEETGLHITGIQPIYTYAKTYADGTHAFFIGYKGILDSSLEVILSDEHDAYVRIDPKDIDMYKLTEYRAETVKRSMK
ncbi:MAG: NUDIX domain-containing protein [candidate division SR1 bacterium]|nr:NUDIX domain-containing protein [candidate division SR1 bacterium]